jgi:hypothetical protein
VIAQLRAELLKQHTTWATFQLFAALIALVVGVILLHELELPVRNLGTAAHQLEVLGQGQRFGILFAALLGALAVTTEFRHGTIRPTFLANPARGRVIAAKAVVAMLIGSAFGASAIAVAIAASEWALGRRGISLLPTGHDYAVLIAGSAAGAALWGAIGVGLGAVVRHQVPLLVGICIWLLFIEGLLFGDIGLSNIGKYLPGSLARAAGGLSSSVLLLPGPALVFLCMYALAAAAAGWAAITKRDVA